MRLFYHFLWCFCRDFRGLLFAVTKGQTAIVQTALYDVFSANGDVCRLPFLLKFNRIIGTSLLLTVAPAAVVMCSTEAPSIDTPKAAPSKWMVCLFALSCWSLFGSVVFVIIEPEWSFIECLYFCFAIVPTVGYGCMGPTSLVSRWFTMWYAAMSFPAAAGCVAGVFEHAMEHPYRWFKWKAFVLLSSLPFFAGMDDDPMKPPTAVRYYLRGTMAIYLYAHGLCCFLLAVLTWAVSQTTEDMFANSRAVPGQRHLDFHDALYFTVITSLTVGFGGVCPQRDNGRVFTIFLGGFGVATISLFINEMGTAFAARAAQLRKARIFQREANGAKLIAQFDSGDDGGRSTAPSGW